MQLWKYEGEHVRITDIDGNVFTGFADIFHHEDDNTSGVASLSLELYSGMENLSFELGENTGIEFEESEIADIEIIPAGTSATPPPTETRLREAHAPTATG